MHRVSPPSLESVGEERRRIPRMTDPRAGDVNASEVITDTHPWCRVLCDSTNSLRRADARIVNHAPLLALCGARASARSLPRGAGPRPDAAIGSLVATTYRATDGSCGARRTAAPPTDP